MPENYRKKEYPPLDCKVKLTCDKIDGSDPVLKPQIKLHSALKPPYKHVYYTDVMNLYTKQEIMNKKETKQIETPLDAKLDFWIKNNLNVLFIGKHGVGKSSLIIDAFNKHGLKWLYFSTSTMDPWVDFVGVPKEKMSEDGTVYLDLVRPKHFQNDEIEAIFFDEFNRSPKKVRNAVMELIQFKSINGKKFNKLRFIWAAVNPKDNDDDTFRYDVEEIDPAQLDRFQIKITLPYEPDKKYFTEKYDEDMADGACEWWRKLDDKVKNLISPRRLDYALEIYKLGGDMRDVLPKEANVNKLMAQLKNGSLTKAMNRIVDIGDTVQGKKFINDKNITNFVMEEVSKNRNCISFFVPLMEEEALTQAIMSFTEIRTFVCDQTNITNFINCLENILNVNKKSQENHMAVSQIEMALQRQKRTSSNLTVSGDEIARIIEELSSQAKVQSASSATKTQWIRKMSSLDQKDFSNLPLDQCYAAIQNLEDNIKTNEQKLYEYYKDKLQTTKSALEKLRKGF